MLSTRDNLTFLLCHGQRDSHALTLAKDGSPNRSPRAGQPYGGMTWPELLDLAEAPAAKVKAEAPAVIASTYRAHDGRAHGAQLERGRFGPLVLDIDTGGPSLEAVEAALAAVAGDAERLIYSTSSATPELPKWRAVVRLAELVPGADWPELQAAFFDCIEAEGLVPDRAAGRTGQIFYLPAVAPERRGADGVPLFYRWRHVAGAAAAARLGAYRGPAGRAGGGAGRGRAGGGRAAGGGGEQAGCAAGQRYA
jgi:hypothetical protein